MMTTRREKKKNIEQKKKLKPMKIPIGDLFGVKEGMASYFI